MVESSTVAQSGWVQVYFVEMHANLNILGVAACGYHVMIMCNLGGKWSGEETFTAPTNTAAKAAFSSFLLSWNWGESLPTLQFEVKHYAAESFLVFWLTSV